MSKKWASRSTERMQPSDQDASVTQALAAWACQAEWEDVPASVQSAVNRSFVNWLGCAIGGSQEPVVSQCLSALAGLSGDGPVVIIGRAEKVDVLSAAFVLAVSSNSLDFDDTHWATGIHPTGPVASAVMAWAGHHSVTGKALQHALLLGMEVACRIGLAVSPEHYQRGWHITSSCGVLGAAVAVGRLMDLTPQQMSWALGHAATQSAGLVASLGSMAKSVNIGHAAKNGLLAAALAQRNVTSSDLVLEAPHGFSQVLGQGSTMSPVLHRLGEQWETLHNTFKPYPCGFVTHPVIDACLALPQAVSLGDILDIELTVHPLAKLRAHRPRPMDGLQAKLSLEHAAAVCLAYQRAGIEDFSDSAVRQPNIVALRRLVRITTDETLSTKEATVRIKCRDGRLICQTAPDLSGANAQGMTDLQLTEKFNQLARYGAPQGNHATWLHTARHLASLNDAADLVAMTSPHTTSTGTNI